MSFEHLKEKKPEERLTEQNSDLISLKADIEALKLSALENQRVDTVKLDEDSETVKGMRIIESKIQLLLEKHLDDIGGKKFDDPTIKTQLENCHTLILLMDKYRHVKAQLEIVKSLEFPTSPVNQ